MLCFWHCSATVVVNSISGEGGGCLWTEFMHHVAYSFDWLIRVKLGYYVFWFTRFDHALSAFNFLLGEDYIKRGILNPLSFYCPFLSPLIRWKEDLFQVRARAGIGPVLMQESRPIDFFSEKLTGAQSRYSTYDAELYAVVRALLDWGHSLPAAPRVYSTRRSRGS